MCDYVYIYIYIIYNALSTYDISAPFCFTEPRMRAEHYLEVAGLQQEMRHMSLQLRQQQLEGHRRLASAREDELREELERTQEAIEEESGAIELLGAREVPEMDRQYIT